MAMWQDSFIEVGTEYSVTLADGDVVKLIIHIDERLIDDMATCIMESRTCSSQMREAATKSYGIWYVHRSGIYDEGRREVGFTQDPWWTRKHGLTPIVQVLLDPAYLPEYNLVHRVNATMTDVIIHENAHALSFGPAGIAQCTDAIVAPATVGCAQDVADRARQREGSGRYIP